MKTRGIALVAGLGLAFGVAAPAAAQDFSSPDAFADDILGCIVDFGISDCVEEVLENEGLEDEQGEFVTTDETPFNPIDEGSVSTEFIDDVTFGSELEED